MRREVISSKDAPAAIGPYSQAIEAGGLIFVSGQIPVDPKTGDVVQGGIEAQTERVIRNIEAILEEAGATLEKVVKTTVYLANLADFAAMNQVYGHLFPVDAPARATVQVARLPKDVLIEIEAIAAV